MKLKKESIKAVLALLKGTILTSSIKTTLERKLFIKKSTQL
jgi:hypothetical protein